MKARPAILVAALLISGSAHAAEGDRVQATLEGEGITGEINMEETASGAILIEVTAEGLPEGELGIHVHETGNCDAAGNFKSAGGHLAMGLEHGVKSAEGPHPGDLPNIHVHSDGTAQAEYFVRGFALGTEGEERILDDDGSAVVIHSAADDYQSQPSGDAGDRIACGVVESIQ